MQELHGVAQVCLDTGDQKNKQYKQLVKSFRLCCSEVLIGVCCVILQIGDG